MAGRDDAGDGLELGGVARSVDKHEAGCQPDAGPRVRDRPPLRDRVGRERRERQVQRAVIARMQVRELLGRGTRNASSGAPTGRSTTMPRAPGTEIADGPVSTPAIP